MLRATEARATTKSTHGRSIWESNLSIFCLSNPSSSVHSWIRSSRFWEYFPSIHSIESATLVFLPWLMLLNWKWNENPNLSMKVSTLGPQVENLDHRNEPDIVPAWKSQMVGSRYVIDKGWQLWQVKAQMAGRKNGLVLYEVNRQGEDFAKESFPSIASPLTNTLVLTRTLWNRHSLFSKIGGWMDEEMGK